MKIIVTGSSGFIGKEVARKLKEKGHQVIEYDLKTGQDVLKPDYPEADAIAHLAGLIEVNESFSKPYEYITTNATGTALLPRDKRVVLASSAAVYGDDSPYKLSKQMAETALGENSVALRIFNPFGETENHRPETHIIPILLEGGATVYQNGLMRRSFIHVKDVARAFVYALEGDFTGAYDICADYSLSIREVAELLNAQDVTYVDNKRDSGDTLLLMGDNSKFKKQCPWFVSYDPKIALKSMANHN